MELVFLPEGPVLPTKHFRSLQRLCGQAQAGFNVSGTWSGSAPINIQQGIYPIKISAWKLASHIQNKFILAYGKWHL